MQSKVLLASLALAALTAVAQPSVGALAATSDPLTVTLATKSVAVPMDVAQGHIAVQVQIAGKEPDSAGTFTFNLDTYAVTTACVDEKFAAEMGFEKTGTVLNGDGSGTVVTRDLVLIPELRVGGATFKNVPALVDDYSWVIGPDGEPVKGLLGYHLFQDLLLALDYPNDRVILGRGELPKEHANVISNRALKTHPDIPIKIGEERFTVGLDSGAHGTLSLPSKLMENLNLEGEPKLIGMARTVYSEEPVLGTTLKDPVTFAGQTLVNERATFSKVFGKALIGHEVMSRFRVTFDQKNGRVQFLLPKVPEGTKDE